ncbi:GSCFA domain-containing protein [Polynucleobacter alcilacus]|uniref:GSCFA domain-containing protein n=1 Tax=Polynucleobacter alcilacus TaxID=1819739 RepID=UPI001C0BCA53|nr:GSCFA domain-containing protein [Polynucleobacter alcilacus]MBU3568575.1 GSCFA domain-containing protein [Polynucleobacter alcilacus]
MKVITIGSCMSQLTASQLVAKYGFEHTHCVYHNRSDCLVDYFIEKKRTQIPLNLISKLLIAKEDSASHADLVLRNQYEENLGFNAIKNENNSTFIEDVKNNQYDVILIDNLLDVSAVLMYPKEMPEFLDSGLCVHLGWYKNENELLEKFRLGKYLTPEESISNQIRLINFLKQYQPTAKIIFIPYHYCSSKGDPARQNRIIGFYEGFKDWAKANKIYVIPPLNVADSNMQSPEDWTHFKSHIYEALASLCYLNICCDLPSISVRPALLKTKGEISPDEISSISNPYQSLPDSSFWKKSVGLKSPELVQPIIHPKFRIGEKDRIASAGSCFAQYIGNVLRRENYKFLLSELGPETTEANNEGYGVFPARFGNVYTVRQLRQLLDRALGLFKPELAPWLRPDGRYVDPFRPNVQESGFLSETGVALDYLSHLKAVRNMFTDSDIFIFTLGLTEGWVSIKNSSVVPLAPGVVGGGKNLAEFRFHNFTYDECFDDLIYFADTLRAINENVKIILTVSPVPLVATYEDEHVLLATTYSKSVLRAAAGNVAKIRDFVDYFPAYELITGNFNKAQYYKENLREVTEAGVEYVMSHFTSNYLSGYDQTIKEADLNQSKNLDSEEIKKYKDSVENVFCDEELLEKIYKP